MKLKSLSMDIWHFWFRHKLYSHCQAENEKAGTVAYEEYAEIYMQGAFQLN